jgi:hypothetical protein
MAIIKTHIGDLTFIETYLGLNVVKDVRKEGETIMVHDPQMDTLFIVCMDDSKRQGKRTFDEAHNTVEAARSYIDWVVKK